ncbi:hypothetical protein TNCT_422551 [Trichonephila clavata]|uniref:Uncharacterized protein n=1 Tax=Trichonephila clavata TaxID=2740835 RepID=A0A8X6KP49_TRICU|nr:hypothetical protein TNCT_422551 [Trichonephila clavata]
MNTPLSSSNVVHEQSLLPDYTTVCCSLLLISVLGPFSLKKNHSFHGLQDCSITATFFSRKSLLPYKSENRDILFMQVGASSHFARPVTVLFHAHFGVD